VPVAVAVPVAVTVGVRVMLGVALGVWVGVAVGMVAVTVGVALAEPAGLAVAVGRSGALEQPPTQSPLTLSAKDVQPAVVHNASQVAASPMPSTQNPVPHGVPPQEQQAAFAAETHSTPAQRAASQDRSSMRRRFVAMVRVPFPESPSAVSTVRNPTTPPDRRKSM
jgi:hypothetical protein